MKLRDFLQPIILCVLIAGCPGNERQEQLAKSRINAETINTLNNIAIENAIIAQHTVFPYHFINNSEKLNALGQKDLSILAAHFKENPGHLNVRRQNASEQLYQGRVDFVIGQLKAAGVETERIFVSDGMAGGPAMRSENVITILTRETEPLERAEAHPGAGYWSGIEK